ncbi:MAG: hypothetical protein AAF405_05570, partial [Pseudomonadota bacterium]
NGNDHGAFNVQMLWGKNFDNGSNLTAFFDYFDRKAIRATDFSQTRDPFPARESPVTPRRITGSKNAPETAFPALSIPREIPSVRAVMTTLAPHSLTPHRHRAGKPKGVRTVRHGGYVFVALLCSLITRFFAFLQVLLLRFT